MFLTTPTSYLTAAQFQAMPLDYDLSTYTTPQIQDLLNRASGKVDSILRRSLLAKERVIRELGSGTNRLELKASPVIYIKKVQIVVPGSTGPLIPIDQILIDYTSGSLLEYTPFYFNGQGYFSRFPDGIPIDVTVATGYGYVYSSPTYTLVDTNGSNGLAPGSYNIAISTKTMWGETNPVVKQVSTTTGNMIATINPTLGGYLYRAYISSAANNTALTGASVIGATTFDVGSVGTIKVGDTLLFDAGANAEYLTVASVNPGILTTTSPALYAHAIGAAVIEQPVLCAESPFTAYGANALQLIITSINAPPGVWQDALSLSDTSAAPVPYAIIEATRILALSMIYEQNNLANRGVYMMRTNRKEVSWKSTEGTSGKGTPLMEVQAAEMLKPYKLQAIF